MNWPRNRLDEGRGRRAVRDDDPLREPESELDDQIIPSSFTGLLAWHEAGEITGLSSGDEIATWADLSANGNTMSAFTVSGGSNPQYQVIDGRAIVRTSYTGPGSAMRFAHTFVGQGYTGWTAFWVGSMNSAPSGGGVYIYMPSNWAGSNNNGVHYNVGAPRFESWHDGFSRVRGNLIELGRRYAVVSTGSDGGQTELYVNGAFLGTTSQVSADVWSGLSFLSFTESASHEAGVYYTRYLTQSERGGVTSYLASKLRVPFGDP